jgi:hypothetical protein
MWARFSFTCVITSISKPSSCACRCALRTLLAAATGPGPWTTGHDQQRHSQRGDSGIR